MGWGQSVDGSVVNGIQFARTGLNPTLPLRFGANDLGQIAYLATLANGVTETRLFTPTLKWRSTVPATGPTWRQLDGRTCTAGVHPVEAVIPAGGIIFGKPGARAQ